MTGICPPPTTTATRMISTRRRAVEEVVEEEFPVEVFQHQLLLELEERQQQAFTPTAIATFTPTLREFMLAAEVE